MLFVHIMHRIDQHIFCCMVNAVCFLCRDSRHIALDRLCRLTLFRMQKQSIFTYDTNFFCKEDCRIEDGSANTMQKLNLIREQKTVSLSKFERICYCLTDCYARCVSIMHNQYILKATLIRDVHQQIVSFIHRKDGQKIPAIFFF